MRRFYRGKYEWIFKQIASCHLELTAIKLNRKSSFEKHSSWHNLEWVSEANPCLEQQEFNNHDSANLEEIKND